MELTELQSYIEKNLSANSISKITGKSLTSIRYWLKKHNLSTKFLSLRYRNENNNSLYLEQNYSDVDWHLVQKFYDDKHSWKEVSLHFKVSRNILTQKIKDGVLLTRKPRETYKVKGYIKNTSVETKRKLSIARKNFLSKNPNKKSWQNTGKKSIPCEYVKELYKKNNISFTEEYEPLLHKNRFFSIDIAFVDKKIGIEINGRQHYDENGKLTKYYQDRHDLIVNEGWTLHEIPYYKAFDEKFMLELVAGMSAALIKNSV